MTDRVAFDPNALIADWQAAYEAANGFKPTHDVAYERGWFRFRNASEGTFRRRRFEVENMTNTLNFRARSQQESKP